jgi:hypothetical protein
VYLGRREHAGVEVEHTESIGESQKRRGLRDGELSTVGMGGAVGGVPRSERAEPALVELGDDPGTVVVDGVGDVLEVGRQLGVGEASHVRRDAPARRPDGARALTDQPDARLRRGFERPTERRGGVRALSRTFEQRGAIEPVADVEAADLDRCFEAR